MDYYRILQISDKASSLEVTQAYTKLLTKWQQVRDKSSSIPKERIDNLISSIELAYLVLSDTHKRAEYDKTLAYHELLNSHKPVEEARVIEQPSDTDTNQESHQATIIEGVLPSTSKTPTQAKKSHMTLLLGVVLILAILAYGSYYFFFNSTNQTITDQSAQTPKIKEKSITTETLTNAQELMKKKPAVNNPITDTAPSKNQPEPIKKDPVTIENTVAPKEAQTQEVPLKNIDELSDMAEKIATSANKYRNSVINKNTVLLGAVASKQDIRLDFKVIEGISESKLLLDTYLKERFIYDNDVCKTQENDIKRGNTFTFAYYNTNYNLLGSYMIDQEVCNSPLERRLIKKATNEQLQPNNDEAK